MAVSVGIRELRSNLRAYLDRVREGEELLVTDRGEPIALIRPPAGRSTLERLAAEGIVTLPRARRQPPRPLEELPTMSEGSLSDIVIEQRRSARF